MRTLLIIFILAIAGKSLAQQTIPFEFTSEDENRQIKENDSVKFYVANGDTTNTVALNEEALYYKLLNKDRKLIAEGAYIMDGDKYLQDGKWTEKYDNGHIRSTGWYRRNLPIGTWQEYYASGKLKTVSNYGLFLYKGAALSALSGTYQEFYPDGKIKVSGFYLGSIYSYKDTLVVEDPVNGQKVSTVVSRNEVRAEKTGHWEYYNEGGELDRKDDF